MKGKTVFGKAHNVRSASSAQKRLRSRPANSIRDSGTAAPKVRMYGCNLPYIHPELKAWQTGGVHVRTFGAKRSQRRYSVAPSHRYEQSKTLWHHPATNP